MNILLFFYDRHFWIVKRRSVSQTASRNDLTWSDEGLFSPTPPTAYDNLVVAQSERVSYVQVGLQTSQKDL